MTSSLRLIALAGSLLAAGCVHGPEAVETTAPASGPVAVEEAPVDVPYVTADVVHGLGGARGVKLEGAASSTMTAMLAPAAVLGPGGRSIAYTAWRDRRPQLRVRELDGGDEVVDEGLSVAWGADGRLGYFKPLKPELGDPRRYEGHVVVRASRTARAVRWTREPGRFVVAAWAGDRLLAYRLGPSWPDLLVLERDRPPRVLAKASGLVALSPDGERAFVTAYGASPPLLRVLDVATGDERARRSVRRLEWVVETGSWVGDLVAATSNAGLAVFRVGESRIALEQVLGFAEAGFPLGPFEPLLDADGRRVVAWAELESLPREALPRAAVLVCDRLEARCDQGPPVSTGTGLRLVHNTSRPAAR